VLFVDIVAPLPHWACRSVHH